MCQVKTFYRKWIIFTVVCRWVGVERRDICIAGRVGSDWVVISDARQDAASSVGALRTSRFATPNSTAAGHEIAIRFLRLTNKFSSDIAR